MVLFCSIMIGLCFLWWGIWALYIIIKTKGNMTFRDLVVHSFVFAIFVSEIKWNYLPTYTPNWREGLNSEMEYPLQYTGNQRKEE